MTRVLHLLSQRAEKTGSGITLDAMVRQAAKAGHEQRVVCALDDGDDPVAVGGLSREAVLPVRFCSDALPFPIVGMSDVMPYRSSVWAQLEEGQLLKYRKAFFGAIERVVDSFKPDLIHSHHVWLMSSLVKRVAPKCPVVVTCHATGLRQMRLCGDSLVAEVRRGCAAIDHFTVLHEGHRAQLCEELDVEPSRATVVGAGYRETTFYRTHAVAEPGSFVFAGKFSRAKGLDALLGVMAKRPEWTLHVAGAGSGSEAEELKTKMAALPNVVVHGMLSQSELAQLMARSFGFVLPSYYEGLPLVLVEAAACGCRLVATRLEGIEGQLAPVLSQVMQLVEPPEMVGPDRPLPAALPAFESRLDRAMNRVVQGGAAMPQAQPSELEAFDWASVFQRVQAVWSRLAL